MKLIENWTSAWRLVSIQATAAVTALNMSWIATPGDLKTQGLNRIVEALTVILGFIGMFGRLIQQKPLDAGKSGDEAPK